MCDELGHRETLIAYVEEAGNTWLIECSIEEGYEGCDEREKGYIEKMKAKSPEDNKAQLDRLAKMEGSSMKPELEQWMKKRKKILRQLVAAGSSGSDEL